MSKEKRLQRKLDRMGKKSGNTASVEDGKQEVSEFIEDNGTKGQKRRATKLYDKINKGSGIKMKSPLDCWRGYERVAGTKEFAPGSCKKA